MNSEESVELTPGRESGELARQLLAVAADPGNPYRVEDVKTTTSGPMGLAFLVPFGLYELWQQSLGLAVAEPGDEETKQEATPRRGRPRRTNDEGKE